LQIDEYNRALAQGTFRDFGIISTHYSEPPSQPARSGVVVIVPARDEGVGLEDALRSIADQTLRPDRVLVVVNNSTDDTEEIARRFALRQRRLQTDVLVMPGFNHHRKAGALNYGISQLLEAGSLPNSVRYLMVMDGDTELDRHFIKRASRIVARDSSLGGLSAACLGKVIRGETPWQDTLLLLQRIEYGRFTSTRLRENVHTMSGAGSFYRADALNDLLSKRADVFEERETNLVEDYETTLALKVCGWRVTSNQKCVAYTDLMPTLGMLRAQRIRWVRGTVDEWRRYGWCKATRLSITGAIACLAGIVYMAAWATFSAWAVLDHGGHLDYRYLLLAVFWSAYQGISAKHMGWKIIIFEMALLPELFFNMLRYHWLISSIFASYRGSGRLWS
jgi:cellulose synthase/poly-beta-1,6-N-acetylglucosamine synthase-like glycosyltransferase